MKPTTIFVLELSESVLPLSVEVTVGTVVGLPGEVLVLSSGHPLSAKIFFNSTADFFAYLGLSG